MNYELEQALKNFIQQEIMLNLSFLDFRDVDYNHVIQLSYHGMPIGEIKVSG